MMYTLKRLAAYGIDLAITGVLSVILYAIISMIGPLPIINGTAEESSVYSYVLFGLLQVLSVGVPILFCGILEGACGWSIGKLCLSLRVKKEVGGEKIGIAQGILRQIVKAVAVLFPLAGLWALYGVITNEKTFYDEWVRSEVEDLKPSGLTDTQKNWRKTMKNR